ncbi:S9 family peptidase [Massilia sp. W12]|uniref:S9 family peptidase n=1 Tax=Massilia sp. W12 TaxID=3126507 RepID=UPI0030CE9170
MSEIKPYGEWRSPISAARVAQGARSLSSVRVVGTDVYWLEGRASEGGRNTLLRAGAAPQEEITPLPFNVRSRVHEYGGGAYLATSEFVVFSHFADHQLHLQPFAGQVLALGNASTQRYADFIHDAQRARIIGVREDHAQSDLQPANTLCSLALDGSGAQSVLAQGHDFYSSPRLSPDGRQLAFLSWDHPRMPWQGTQLWLADFAADGALQNLRCVAGGAQESICQPEWSPQGELFFVSDRSGWWNLYRLDAQGAAHALCPREAEFGAPHWTFGEWMYGFVDSARIVASYIENGDSHLALLQADEAGNWSMQALPLDYTDIHELAVCGEQVALVAASPTIPLQVACLDLASRNVRVLASSIAELPPASYLSRPRSISYPSHGRTAHAMFYAPKNDDYQAPAGELPPLLVFIHGGPTGMASSNLRLPIQFWTSRGFAVLDVNYGGSSGFGRAYRDLLQGQWGVVDVQDCVAGAQYLAQQGLVDAQRLVIRGGSAGGFTTLCALAFYDVFKAGASIYGVSDLAALDADSHKFESHYNAYLIGPREQAQQIYLQRSPVHHVDKLKRPMIFLQGLDDKVVPPSQSETMVQALRQKGVPVAYLSFAGEGHGFRQAATIERAWEAELYFYAKVFGFTLADVVTPVQIENLPD